MAQDVVQKYQKAQGFLPFLPTPKPPQHQSFSSVFKTSFVSSLQKFSRILVGFFLVFSPPIFLLFSL